MHTATTCMPNRPVSAVIWRLFALIFIAITFTGCATTRLIDSDVQAHSSFRSAPLAGYRFERLPSQQTGPESARQAALEVMAEPALARVGLRRDDAQPGYALQLSLLRQHFWAADPYGWPGTWGTHIGVGWRIGGGRRGGGFGSVGFGRPLAESPWYAREVTVLLRDLATQQVVFESRARHVGPWSDEAAIVPVVIDAAMQGFPTPPSGPRRVTIELQPASSPATSPATAPATPPAKPTAP